MTSAALVLLGAIEFVTLDHARGEERAGTTAATALYATDDSDGTPVDVAATRADLWGELQFGSLSLTSTVPLVWVHGQEEHVGLGAIHLGAAWALPAGPAVVRLRGGLRLPTETFAPDSGYETGLALAGPMFQRLEEPAVDDGVPWARGGLTARVDRGALSLQADISVEVPVLDVDGPAARPVRAVLGLGAGTRLGPTQLTAEVVTSGYPFAGANEAPERETTGGGTSLDGRLFTTAALSVGGPVAPGMTLAGHALVPLDEYLRSNVFVVGVSLAYSR